MDLALRRVTGKEVEKAVDAMAKVRMAGSGKVERFGGEKEIK